MLPCEQRLIAAIRALGVPVRLHICGNTKRIVEGMGQTGADIIDLDFPTPLGHARRAMRETQVLLGNIDPVRRVARRHARIGGSGAGRVLPAGGRGLYLRRRLRGAARHAARQRGRHGAVRAQPLVKLELHPRAQQTLADQLFAAGVEFPCGGESACGGCKVRVLEGEVPVTATMRDALSEEEIRDGWRLACCASAAERVVVEVEQWSLRVLTDERVVPDRAARGARRGDRPGHHHAGGPGGGSRERRSSTRGDRAQPAGALRRRRDEPPAIRPATSRANWGRLIREALGRMLGSEPLREVLVAGNTAMHHLFCGLDVEPLTRAPFLSPTLGGYRFANGGPGMAGAGRIPALPGRIRRQRPALRHRGHAPGRAERGPRALFDIGTNGEVVVGSAQGIRVRVDGGRPGV